MASDPFDIFERKLALWAIYNIGPRTDLKKSDLMNMFDEKCKKTIMKRIDELEKAGFIEVDRKPRSYNTQYLKLTDHGMDVYCIISCIMNRSKVAE